MLNRSFSLESRHLAKRQYGDGYVNRGGNMVSKEDEIGILKREKQNLIQEKSLLKAKITRLRNKASKPPQKKKQNIQNIHGLLNNLEVEIKKITQLAASKRTEIETIKQSDRAAVITELQEECLILHQEIIRMKRTNAYMQKQTKDMRNDLMQKQADFSENVYNKQKKERKELKYSKKSLNRFQEIRFT